METTTKLDTCPGCGAHRAKAVDSRLDAATRYRRRRRECIACGHRWNTIEVPAELVESLLGMRNRLQDVQSPINALVDLLRALPLGMESPQ